MATSGTGDSMHNHQYGIAQPLSSEFWGDELGEIISFNDVEF